MTFLKKPGSTMRYFLTAVLLSACSLARAEFIDHIDATPGEHDAEIVIHFTERALYLRHTSLPDEKNLRIFIRFPDTKLFANDLIQETVRSPKTDRVPIVTVLYPELINGMLVTFSKKTEFSVRPGEDGRSIIITVPLLPAVKTSSVTTPLVKPPAVMTSTEKLPTEKMSTVITPSEKTTLDKMPAVPAPAEETPAEKIIQDLPPAPTLSAAPVPTAMPAVSEPIEAVSPDAKENLMPQVLPPALSAAEVERRAATYMEDARSAIAAKDPATAINRLNRILGLPTSIQTEAAQALIGEAREINGEILKARAEYELYIKLFPDGPNAPRVRERLTALPKDAAVARATLKPLPKEAGPAEWTYNSSISSYYYTGKSQIETLLPPPPGQLTFSREALSMVDQDSLITSINLNARRRDGFTDTRIVVRDTDNKNYLSPSRSYNRLYSAYVDHTDRKIGYYLKFGRQNPNGMGVMDRFDGLQTGYNLNTQWRVNAVYGDAVEFGSPFRKNFYGASVDLLPQTGLPGVSAYAIEQTLDGLANRRAVGSEVRYFDGHVTAYGMLDYDVLYKGINIALLQGNYLSEKGDNYFFVIDHRRAPSFSLTNALPAALGLSLQDMVATQGIAQVRAQATALTAMSDMFSVGVTHPLTENWQVGVDYRMSSISSTQPALAVLPLAVIGTCLGTIDPVNNTCVIDTASQPASGMTHAVTFQTVGTNLFFTNAVGIANLSLIQAPTYTGQALSLGYALPLREQWRIDANLHYYTQNAASGDKQDRISPSMKLSYKWLNSLYLEGEAGREISNTSGPTRNDHSQRDYIYMGVRWDLH